MKRPKVIFGTLLVAVVINAFGPRYLHGAKPNVSPSFGQGNYIFHIMSPDLSAKEADVKYSSTLGTEPEFGGMKPLVIRMRRANLPWNNLADLRGVVQTGRINIESSNIEQADVVSTHFVGSVVGDNRAKGTMVMMKNGAIVARGNWTLEKDN